MSVDVSTDVAFEDEFVINAVVIFEGMELFSDFICTFLLSEAVVKVLNS